MSDRIFKQHALGKVGQVTNITAKIDGEVVFSGTVTASDQPFPAWPNWQYTVENVAYTWTGNAAFQGTIAHEVTVTSGSLLLADTVSNNPLQDPDLFGRLDQVIVDGEVYKYPYISGSVLNGQPIGTATWTPWITGQPWYELKSGDVLVSSLNVVASLTPPPPPPPPPPNEDPI